MEEGVISSGTTMIKQDMDNMQSLKLKVTTICQATQFCAVCLGTNNKMWSVHTEFDIVVETFSHKKRLIDIIDYILNNEADQILASSYLCSHCIEKSIQAYLFVYNARNLSKIIEESVNDLYSKTIDVKNQLQTFKDDQSANVFILLEQHEANQCVDISETTQIVAVETLNSDKVMSESGKILKVDDIKIESIQSNYNEGVSITEKDKTKHSMLESKQEVPSLRVKNLQSLSGDEQIEAVYLEPDYDGLSEEDNEVTYLDEDCLSSDVEIKENSQTSIEISIPKKKRKLIYSYNCCNCKEVLPSRRKYYEHRKKCVPVNNDPIEYKCKVCAKIFSTQNALSSHYKSHSKIKCKVCNFIVPRDDLHEHVHLNHEEFKKFCISCHYFCSTADQMKAHREKNHSGPKCALCLKMVKENDLKMHRCKFSCSECIENICIHFRYLISFKKQFLKKMTKIKCLDCDYVCTNKKALLGHVNRDHLDHHPFTCDHCQQQFYSRTAVGKHISIFHLDRLICEFCDHEFASTKNLEAHRKLCENIKKDFKCDSCKSSFVTLQELDNHVKIRHEGGLECELCNRKLLTKEKLHDHMFKVHSGVQVKRTVSHLLCPICNMKCGNKQLLLQHIKRHGPNARLPCKKCDETFDGLRKLNYHMRSHDEGVIECTSCKKVFSKTYYPHHTVYCTAKRNSRPLRKPKFTGTIECDICKKTFTYNQYRFHKQTHLEKAPCPICKKLLKPCYMRVHIRFSHKKSTKQRHPKKFECEYCAKRFSNTKDLENHVNKIHLKIKPYQCDYCKKMFCGKERLSQHLTTHSTASVCYCSICNKKFTNKVTLKRHMPMHTGEKPYPCDICGESFRTSTHMNTHRVKKHSERTVPCPLCERMFFLTREMRTHFRKVHWKRKDKKFDPRDVKELNPKFYHLFEDGRVVKVAGEGLCLASGPKNEKFVSS